MAIIEVEGLTRCFGDFVAVDHISFKVEEGQVFGFLGPNGAGKSTTIRILTTLLQPTSGTARIAGHDLRKEPAQIRKEIGLVAEKLIVYDRLTARENLRLFGRLNHIPDEVIRQRTDHWLAALKMDVWADHLLGTFSTGMKQRVNIARALLNMPRVLFLDEPTLGLDPQTTRTIRDFILELRNKGMTIVLTTHQMYEAEALCDTIGIIDHGRIVAMGTTDELKRILNGDRGMVVDVEIPNLTESMVTTLKALPGIGSIGQESATHLRVHLLDGNFGDALSCLIANGARVAKVNTAEPTLEDVFLHLTGHQMRDAVQDKVPNEHRRWRRAANRIR